MKKIFILLLSGLFFAGTVQAQISDNIGSIFWTLVDNELTLSGTGEIPNSFFGYTSFDKINKDDVKSVVINEGITSIKDFVFVSYNITSVTIPASVTMIDVNAFKKCEGLTTIKVNASNPLYYFEDGVLFKHDDTLFTYPEGKTGAYSVPDGVKIIGENAFWLCQKVTSVTISPTVTTIEEYAFANSSISSVTINGTGLTKINEGAFDSCADMVSINIPTSVTFIGDYAFWGCEILTSITIPALVTHIGYGIVRDCDAMTSISVADGNTVYSSVDGVLFDKTKTTLIEFPGGKSGKYLIPEKVEKIENMAFYNCKKLTSVTIPASVTTINDNAFAECKYLSSVVNLRTVPQTISDDVFAGVNLSACTLQVPDAKAYRDDPEWGKFGTIKPLEVKITLNLKEICLLIDATSTLIATVESDEITSNTVVWESSYPTVASVDITGKVTALKTGSTEITATAYGSSAKCSVTVMQPGNSSIVGTVDNPGGGKVRVNLYINTNDPGQTKRGIIGGYVLLATTIPNENGEYSFDDLPEGSYQVELVYEDSEAEATEALELSDNETLTDIDFSIKDGVISVFDPPIDPTTRTEDNLDAGMVVYPNPFTDAVRITVETWRAASMCIQVISAAGVIVHTQTIASPDETIHLGHLAAGMYILRMENGKTVKTVKIIKSF